MHSRRANISLRLERLVIASRLVPVHAASTDPNRPHVKTTQGSQLATPSSGTTATDIRGDGEPAKQTPGLWQRGQHGWPASYPIVMFPNVPLLAALLAYACSTLASGEVSNVLTAISRVALAVWAYLELTDGGNAVRRILGLGFLAYVISTLAAAQH